MDITKLETEVLYLEEQTAKRKRLLSLQKNDNLTEEDKEAIDDLLNSLDLLPVSSSKNETQVILNKDSFNYELEKQKIEIAFFRDKLAKAKIRTLMMKICIPVFLISLGASYYLAYLNPINEYSMILVGLSLAGFILSIATSLTVKLPSKSELTVRNGD